MTKHIVSTITTLAPHSDKNYNCREIALFVKSYMVPREETKVN
jgi:hypothetical protein